MNKEHYVKIYPDVGNAYTVIIPIPENADEETFINKWIDKNLNLIESYEISPKPINRIFRLGGHPLDAAQINFDELIIKKFFKSDKWSYNDFEEFTNMPISAKILDSGIMYYIEDTIEQMPDDILKTFSNKYEEKLK